MLADITQGCETVVYFVKLSFFLCHWRYGKLRLGLTPRSH